MGKPKAHKNSCFSPALREIGSLLSHRVNKGLLHTSVLRKTVRGTRQLHPRVSSAITEARGGRLHHQLSPWTCAGNTIYLRKNWALSQAHREAATRRHLHLDQVLGGPGASRHGVLPSTWLKYHAVASLWRQMRCHPCIRDSLALFERVPELRGRCCSISGGKDAMQQCHHPLEREETGEEKTQILTKGSLWELVMKMMEMKGCGSLKWE